MQRRAHARQSVLTHRSLACSSPLLSSLDLRLGFSLSHRAGSLLHRSWCVHPNERNTFHTKSSSADVVTETDQECERIILDGIKAAYPQHRFIGEESHATDGVYAQGGPNDITWIVDPIDGTNNFIHQLPSVAVSIGIMRGPDVIVGIVHTPVSGETFYATRGGGAFVTTAKPNEKGEIDQSSATRLRSSQITTLQRACVATEMGYSRSVPLLELMQAKTAALLTQGLQSLRMSGSCCVNMVHVAAGRLDAYYEGINTSSGPRPWDVCAGSLIVTESGGCVQDVSGSPFSLWNGRVLVASTVDIAAHVSAAINQATQAWTEKYPDLAEAVKYKIADEPTNKVAKL